MRGAEGEDGGDCVKCGGEGMGKKRRNEGERSVWWGGINYRIESRINCRHSKIESRRKYRIDRRLVRKVSSLDIKWGLGEGEAEPRSPLRTVNATPTIRQVEGAPRLTAYIRYSK